MPVAISYQKYPVVGEPYLKNSKMYIQIQMKNGTKEVRYYTQAEFDKIYKGKTTENFVIAEPAKPIRTRKETLGFKNGYITIYKGNTYPHLDWFRASKVCRYSNLWGWYTTSEEELPTDIPEDVETVRVPADVVFVSDNELKMEDEIKAGVENLIYSEKKGEFVGEVGDKIEAYLTVDMARELDGYYGRSVMHKFHDDLGNIYVWTTAAKTLEVGKTYNITGKIKELKTYRGENENVLTRCRVLN